MKEAYGSEDGNDAKDDTEYKIDKNNQSSSEESYDSDEPVFRSRSKPSYQCKICKKDFFNQILLNKHNFLHHSENVNLAKHQLKKKQVKSNNITKNKTPKEGMNTKSSQKITNPKKGK